MGTPDEMHAENLQKKGTHGASFLDAQITWSDYFIYFYEEFWFYSKFPQMTVLVTLLRLGMPENLLTKLV